MNKPIIYHISFADASLVSFNYVDNSQIMNIWLEAWNEQIIKLDFESVLFFQYQPGDFISEIYQNTDSEIIHNSLIKEYGKLPDKHNYKLFFINDINDFPFIQVVSNNLLISTI